MADLRQIAIGDIHGCVKTFRFLVQNELQVTSNDHLKSPAIHYAPKSEMF